MKKRGLFVFLFLTLILIGSVSAYCYASSDPTHKDIGVNQVDCTSGAGLVWVSDSASSTTATPTDTVSTTTNQANSQNNWLDSSWNWVKEGTRPVWAPIGDKLGQGANYIEGIFGVQRTAGEWATNFFYNLFLAALAIIFMRITYEGIKFLRNRGTNYSEPRWLGFFASDVLRGIIFSFAYAFLMSIAVINRVIQIVTLYTFVPDIWVIAFVTRAFFLALILGLLPQTIKGIYDYYKDIKRDQAIKNAVGYVKLQRAVGKEWSKT